MPSCATHVCKPVLHTRDPSPKNQTTEGGLGAKRPVLGPPPALHPGHAPGAAVRPVGLQGIYRGSIGLGGLQECGTHESGVWEVYWVCEIYGVYVIYRVYGALWGLWGL